MVLELWLIAITLESVVRGMCSSEGMRVPRDTVGSFKGALPVVHVCIQLAFAASGTKSTR